MQETTNQTLYAHSSRPQWGLAILAWEGRDKRRYQFQDGKLRTFKRGYYEKLEPVTQPDGRPEEIARDLKNMLRASRAHRAEVASEATSRSKASGVTVDDQIALFRKSHPEGFADPRYRERVRGEGATKTSKRHVGPSIELAQAELSADSIDGRIAAGDHVGVRDALASVLRSTDLASSKDAAAIARVSDEGARELTDALRDVLHGAAPFEARFTRWVETLAGATDERPSWPLVTAPLALVHPNEHLCVRPTVFRRQAKRLAPELKLGPKPTAVQYERLRTMASVLSTRLEQAGMAPEDLIDVYQFVGAPRRRKALDQLEG